MKNQNEIQELRRKVAELETEKLELAAIANTRLTELDQAREGLAASESERDQAILGRAADKAVLERGDIYEKAQVAASDRLLQLFKLEGGQPIMRDQASGKVVMGNDLLAPRTMAEHLEIMVRGDRDYLLASHYEAQTASPQDELEGASAAALFSAALTSQG